MPDTSEKLAEFTAKQAQCLAEMQAEREEFKKLAKAVSADLKAPSAHFSALIAQLETKLSAVETPQSLNSDDTNPILLKLVAHSIEMR